MSIARARFHSTLTGVGHQLDSVTHHAHLMQTRLSVEEYVATKELTEWIDF